MDSQKVSISKLGEILCDENTPLKNRFRALFGLKYDASDEAVEMIEKAFTDSSALLKHELAYCLGQMRNKRAIACLKKILNDQKQEPMVRHEAGEALGAIGSPEVLETLEKYVNDSSPEVAETCQLAIRRINWLASQDNMIADWEKNPYNTIDPAPPSGQSRSVDELKAFLLNPENSLWDRYRAMFRLRNIKTDEAVAALAEGLRCEDSALFRHEIAFVLGQLKSALAVRHLIERLQLKSENCMVRHECAETLGAIGTETCQKILRDFLNDSERVVRESCEVALDISDYENSDEFQYAGTDDYLSGTPSSPNDSNSGGNYFSSVGF